MKLLTKIAIPEPQTVYAAYIYGEMHKFNQLLPQNDSMDGRLPQNTEYYYQ